MAENSEADAVAGIPLAEGGEAHEVVSELPAVGEEQQAVEGVVHHAKDGAYDADAAAAHLAAAGHLAADAYQQHAEHYAYYQQHPEHYQHHHSDGESEEADPNAETGLFIPGSEVDAETPQQLTVADVDAMAVHPEGEWTAEQEHELVQVITDEHYRAEKMGAPWAAWSVAQNRFAPVAAYTKRTIRDVRQKVKEKLSLPEVAAAAAAAMAHHEGDAQQAAAAAHHEGADGAAAGADSAAAAAAAAAAHDAAVGTATGLPQHALPLMDGHLVASLGYHHHLADHHMQMQTHITTEQMHQMHAQVQQMTPEQMHIYHQQMSVLSQFTVAPGQVAYPGAEGAAEGLPADAAAAAAAYPAGIDPHLLAHQMAAVAQSPFPIPLPVASPAGAGTTTTNPRNDRHFWKEHEQQELLRLVADQAYRQSVLGISELNWDAIAKHLGRGKRSVQRKYDNLKGSLSHGPPGAAPLPLNDGKKWSAEEVTELLALVEDENYRRQRLGLEKVDWRVFGQHFGRSYESVSYKYSYIKNTGRTGQEGKAKHAKAKHETSYKEMAIYALQQLAVKTGVPEGTSGQICGEIILNPVFQPQLDTAIVSGKKTLQRWKHGVRSALNAFPMFTKTGAVRDGEVVWRLEETALQAEQEAQAAKLHRSRNKPMSGAQRRKMKKVTAESGGEGEGEAEEGEAGEEAAHEALASMMSSQRPPSARLASKRKPGRHADSDDDYEEELGKERAPRKKKAKAAAPRDPGAANGVVKAPGAEAPRMPGLALGAGVALPAGLPPEMFAAVLPLMMQSVDPSVAQQAALMAGLPAEQQQAYAASLTPEQQASLAQQQEAAAARGNIVPAGAVAPGAPAPAANGAAATNGEQAAAAAPAAAVAGEVPPWLAQVWPAGPAEHVGQQQQQQQPLSAEAQQSHAAVMAAFGAAAAPAPLPAPQQPQAQQQAVSAGEAAAPAVAPAVLDPVAIFAAAEAAAARQVQLLEQARLDAGSAAAHGSASTAGTPEPEVKAEQLAEEPPPHGEASQATAGQQEQAATPGPQAAAGAPELEAGRGTPEAAAAAAGDGAGDAAAAAAASAADEPAADDAAAAAAAASTEQQMAELHAWLGKHGPGMEGAEAVAVGGMEGTDPATMAHLASLDAEQQQAYLAQQHHAAYDPHHHLYHHHHHHEAAATAQLPFDAAAVFGATEGHPAHAYDPAQYHGEAAAQYHDPQYHAADPAQAAAYAAAGGEHQATYAASDQHAAPDYHQQHYQGGEYASAEDATQHYAADGQQHYAADGQYAEHGQYDQQYTAADHGQYAAADGQQQYAEHGQYAEHHHEQAYTAEQQAAYAAEHGQAYSTEHGQAYSTEQAAYSTEHGQAYSTEHGQAYSSEQQAAYEAQHGQAYTAEQQAAYEAQQAAGYGGEHAAGYPAEHYAAYAEQQQGQEGEYPQAHGEGGEGAAYGEQQQHHDAAAAEAAGYAQGDPAAQHYDPTQHQPAPGAEHEQAAPHDEQQEQQAGQAPGAEQAAGEPAAAEEQQPAEAAAAYAGGEGPAPEDEVMAEAEAAPGEAGEAGDLVAGMFAADPAPGLEQVQEEAAPMQE